MRLLAIVFCFAVLCMIMASGASFAALGDKTSGTVKFHTISSSTKRSCTTGEQRIDKSYLYVCYSTGSGKWKRISLGNPY